MDQFLKLSWGDVGKWLTLIVGIVTTFVVMQVKVSNLEEGRLDNRNRINDLELRVRTIESCIAESNAKLTTIQSDVTVIKNAILNSTLNPSDRH